MDVEGVKGRARVRERTGEEGERRRVEEGGRRKGEEGGAGDVAHPPGCRVDDRCSGAGVETMRRRHGPLLPNQRAAADRTGAICNKQFSQSFKGKRYTRCREILQFDNISPSISLLQLSDTEYCTKHRFHMNSRSQWIPICHGQSPFVTLPLRVDLGPSSLMPHSAGSGNKYSVIPTDGLIYQHWTNMGLS